MDDPTILREAIFEVIDNQIENLTPPETKETYDRLLAEGFPEEEVMKYIGCVVSSEIFGILREGKPYNEEAYVKALRALPKLPWDES